VITLQSASGVPNKQTDPALTAHSPRVQKSVALRYASSASETRQTPLR
jgi:hypothetical protein